MGLHRMTIWRYRWHEIGRIRRAYRWLRWILPVKIRILFTRVFRQDPEEFELSNSLRLSMAWYRAGAFQTITEILEDFPERDNT
jgi:hypothetical protein